MGIFVLCFSGCGKKQEAAEAPPAHAPASYMNDPVFRKQLTDKRLEIQEIVAERAPLEKRMLEIVQSNGTDLAVLTKIPEWNELYKKVSDLNTKYEQVRQHQLKIASERMKPKAK